MRLTTLFAGAGALVAVGVLSQRILDLEQRVAMLDTASKVQAAAAPAPLYVESSSASDENAEHVEPRLQSFETRVEVLENAPPNSRRAGSVDERQLRAEQDILAVVEREQKRVRDAQLDWYKTGWQEARKQLLTAFADTQKLKPAQTSKLDAALENELNALVDVMKRPRFAEEPDEVADDWLEVLSRTDRRAEEVLEPAQYQSWLQGRALGRKVLWPWLPDKPKEPAER